MVTKKTEAENKLTLKTLSIIAGLIFTLLSTLAGAFVYVDGKYVHQDIYAIHVEQNEEEFNELEEKTAELFVATQAANQRELNKIRQEIKAASALPLIVRRDVLTLRQDRLTSDEAGELAIIRDRLNDLNID